MTTISTIRYRTVMMRLLHNSGSVAACQKAAIEHNKIILQRMRITQAQQKLANEAKERLHALVL